MAMIGSVTAGSGSPSAVGSGSSSVQRNDGWLVSGLEVGLEISSSEGQRVSGDPLFSSTHSTKAVKSSSLGPFAGRRTIHLAVREVGKACQIEKVPGIVFQRTVHLLQAQELDGWQVHSGRGDKQNKKERKTPLILLTLRVCYSVMGAVSSKAHDEGV